MSEEASLDPLSPENLEEEIECASPSSQDSFRISNPELQQLLNDLQSDSIFDQYKGRNFLKFYQAKVPNILYPFEDDETIAVQEKLKDLLGNASITIYKMHFLLPIRTLQNLHNAQIDPSQRYYTMIVCPTPATYETLVNLESYFLIAAKYPNFIIENSDHSAILFKSRRLFTLLKDNLMPPTTLTLTHCKEQLWHEASSSSFGGASSSFRNT